MWKQFRDLNYEVSEDAVIRNISTGKILTESVQPDGYVKIYLYTNGIRSMYYLHRIVAECYIVNPDKLPEVNHKNKIRGNCKSYNLEWSTRKDNMIHGKGKPVRQLLNNIVIEEYVTLSAAAFAMNDKSHGANIHRVIKGTRKSAYGFNWEYIN